MINLKRILNLDQNRPVFECRRCGTNVDADTDVCPECGSEEIIHYDLE